MRVPVYIVCAAVLVVAVNSEERSSGRPPAMSSGASSAAAASSSVEEQDALIAYLLPRLMLAKYRPYRREWPTLPYYPTPYDGDNSILDDSQMDGDDDRSKRAGRNGLSLREVGGGGGPSLSISNSLDVLRNRLLLEMSRKKELEGANRNRDLLCKIGKRGAGGYVGKRRCEEEKFVDDN